MNKKKPLSLIDSPGIQPEVKQAIKAYVERMVSEFSDQVVSITLYGSQARGDAEPGADIDLFIVLQREVPALRQALAELAWQIQFDYNVVISDLIRNASQLREMQVMRFPLYQNIESEGIVLWKNPSELMPAYD